MVAKFGKDNVYDDTRDSLEQTLHNTLENTGGGRDAERKACILKEPLMGVYNNILH